MYQERRDPPARVFRLPDPGDRARVYELGLREGTDSDVLRYLDGVLLVDLWGELVLPEAVRAAWCPLMGRSSVRENAREFAE